MRRNLISLTLLTFVVSIILVFQNCGKGYSAGGARKPSSSGTGTDDALPMTASGLPMNEAQELAQDMHRRLTGTTGGKNDKIYQDMVTYIAMGERKKAALLAMNSPYFYHVIVRDFAGKMSTREGNSLAPLSDFVATVIGVVRDSKPATELLTGDYIYKGTTSGQSDIIDNVVKSNKHYTDMEENGTDLVKELKQEKQQYMDGNTLRNITDTAGLLTSRAFMMAHAYQGTNRRIIEYSFKVFLCSPIDTWASTSNPDSHIGREIGRNPPEEFNNKCRGCHSGMDALRPATAYFDFDMTNQTTKVGFTTYKRTADDNGAGENPQIASKFRRGRSIFPGGYAVMDDEWVNYADKSMFGWNTRLSGSGMNELGQMLAKSDAFASCMAKKVYATVCRSEVPSTSADLIMKMAGVFKSSNYNLKELFAATALRPECMGVPQ